MDQPLEHFAKRLTAVRRRIERAALDAGRDPAGVTLVAVSKFHPADAVKALYDLGQRDFGENYVQETRDKFDGLDVPEAKLHFIGRFQTNKAKYMPGRFQMVQTIDSERAAVALAEAVRKKGAPPMPVIVAVNVGEEPQKSGAEADKAQIVLRAASALPELDPQGLMCLPPFFDDPAFSRPYYDRLRMLRDAIRDALGLDLAHLSMGMSHDLEEAVAAGATIVRIGTDLFGPRETV